jgi:RimJ/RimL family protein N-acetyltransferase
VPTQLNPDNYEVIRDLFPKNYPNLAFIYAAIEKKIKGEIWAENLSHHLGFMLWDKQSQCVAGEAFGFVGGDLMEIGTNPEYVKKGLSTNVCARLIQEATKKGLHPLWSCSKDNIPSNKTAQKLGMEAKQEYSFHNIGKKL